MLDFTGMAVRSGVVLMVRRHPFRGTISKTNNHTSYKPLHKTRAAIAWDAVIVVTCNTL